MTGQIDHESKEAQRLARLCKVAEHVAASVLEEASADGVLRHCEMLGVVPGARSCMVITVGLRASCQAPGIATVHEALEGLKGHLRSELARAINRKRVPSLAFDVVPLGSARRDDEE